jgi:hypothetical protein
MYNAQVYPIYVVIDRDGNIAGEQRGSAGERGLRRMLRRAGLEAEPPFFVAPASCRLARGRLARAVGLIRTPARQSDLFAPP